MAKKSGFHAHHAHAKKAFDAGDHSTAAKHIGHMFAAVKAAQRGATYQTPAPGISDDDQFSVTQSQPPDQSAPPQQMTPKGPAFNRNRFAAMKGKLG